TFADLQARIAQVLSFVESLDAAEIDAAAEREIVTQAGTPKEKRFSGQSYLLNYGLPHFFFHEAAYRVAEHHVFVWHRPTAGGVKRHRVPVVDGLPPL
ncbi:MAG: DUF1993 family protein, partial [Haliea sp.]